MAVTIDNTPDLDFTPTKPNAPRTLLLAPPSLASNEPALAAILSDHDRTITDLQMLDRLGAGLVRLPESTYDLVLVLGCAEALPLLSREVVTPVAEALRPAGKMRGLGGRLDAAAGVVREAVLAGLVADESGEGGYLKPDYGDGGGLVQLVRLKKKDKLEATKHDNLETAKQDKPETVVVEPSTKTVTLDLGDDLDGDDGDDDLIDEDALLTEEDMTKTISIPPECVPKVGKRRRACKDCTCGLAEKLASEDADKRATADAKLATITLSSDDLAEVDFTVQGKVGSCGNCALGDAFRCDGCPYIGMPKFEWGQEVKLLNNEVQL